MQIVIELIQMAKTNISVTPKYWFEFYLLPIFSETKRNIFLDFFEKILMLIIFEVIYEGFN